MILLAQVLPLATGTLTFSPQASSPAIGWESYLPTPLQLPQLYFGLAVCVATVCACRALPDAYRKPWITQLITAFVGCGIMVGEMGFNVYALGTGVIASSLSTTFYDLAFSAIESRVRALLGASPSQTPTTLQPGPNLEDKGTK